MKFNEIEIEFIKCYYISHGLKYCSEKLNRNKGSIQKLAHRLSLKVDRKLMLQNNPELFIHLQQHAKKILQPINIKNILKIDKEEVRKLYIEGKSSIEISKIFNCSKPRILKELKDIPKRKNKDYKSFRNYNQFGDKNPSWKGGIKSIYDRVRGLNIYWNWHKEVLHRDSNTCQHCNATENLQVHHITTLKSLVLTYCEKVNKEPKDLTEMDLHSEHFYSIDNGLTLCETCHKKYHKQFGR